MTRISLVLQLFALYGSFRPSWQTCYSFLNKDIGHLVPDDFTYVEEGTTMRVECSLDKAFAGENSLTADDIVWHSPAYEHLTSDLDKRVNLTTPDSLTMVLEISNITTLDDGQYYCSVTINGQNRRLCSVEVPVAGPAKKYLDFSCESENFDNLICRWRKSGYYTGRSKMKYTLKYHTAAGSAEYDCPKLTTERGDWYKCEWNATIMNALHPPSRFFAQYHHYFTINGTNSFGSEVWTEDVSPTLVVRPAAPLNLTTVVSDDHSCIIKWSIAEHLTTDFKQTIGLLTQIDVGKAGPTAPKWTTMADNIEEQKYAIQNLDAFTNYSIRVRSRPKVGGFWGSYGNLSCTTQPAIPAGDLGIVPGAYEEVGNGGQRRVTLYWQGIPEHKRNGPDFRYKIISRSGQETRDLGETPYANYFIAAPANSSIFVDVIPINQQGEGLKETAMIPAVRDSPLVIDGAHVVRFAAESRYELSWNSNRQADTYDLFWCPTSLKPHLAKCTDLMHHTSISGDLQAYNLTLNPDHEYRFAVAGRVGDSWSGMTWIAQQCQSTDEYARLEGLTATAMANASVHLTWDLPCQHRFLRITGYRVFYYRCDIDRPKECTPDTYVDVLNGTALTLHSLHPARRYCFLMMVLDDINSSSPYVHKVEQCITTSELVPPLPMSSIVGGSVAGAIVLVIFAFILWRLIKRMRNDFKEIQKQSRVINLPPVMFDKYDDGYSQERTHYTKVDLDGTGGKSFTRQLSNVSEMSSSGHGSVTSEGTSQSSRISGSDDTDGQYLTKRVDMISGLTGTRLVAPSSPTIPTGGIRVKHRHSTFDLDNLARNLHKRSKLPDTVSLGSSNSSLTESLTTGPASKAKPRLRIRVPSNAMSITVPVPRKPSLLNSSAGGGTATDSGLSDSQASSGYVPAVVNPVLTAQVSLGTPDNGYISQQSTMSHSLNGSEVSVFSDLDSPLGGVRKGKAVARGSISEEDGRNDDFGGSEGDLHQTMPVTRGKSCPPPEKVIPAGSGYVAWP